ncbi:MAG: sulfotransferase family 2 domain-containing protein [Acidobacteriota bacterium]
MGKKKRGIFFHIPKTGGMTLYDIIEREYSEDERFKIAPNDIEGSARRFVQSSNNNDIRIVYGHMNFGLHRGFQDSVKYFTILRDPVKRIISVYNYAKEEKYHHLNKYIKENKISLSDFIESTKRVQFNNAMVRSISGIGGKYKFNEGGSELRDIAVNNIENFFIITGFIDYYDEVLVLLKNHFNWSVPFYIKKNVTKNKPDIENRDEVNEIIGSYNKLDVELYDLCRVRFLEKIEMLGQNFQDEVRAFKTLNNIYQDYFRKNNKGFSSDFSNDIRNKINLLNEKGEKGVADYCSAYLDELMDQ